MSYQDEMRKRLDETFAAAWRPEPGDDVMGVVESLTTIANAEYGDYPCLTLQRIVNDHVTAERIAVHCFHESLRRGLERDAPERDDVVAIRYDGKQRNERTDRTFHSYKYSVDHAPPQAFLDEVERLRKVVAEKEAAYDEPF